MVPKILKMLAACVVCSLVFGASGASAQQQYKLTFIAGAPAIYYLPQYIAEEAGFFKREHVTLEQVRLNSAPQMVAAMMGGSADLLAINFALVVAANEKGGDLIEIGTTYDTFPLSLVLSNAAIKKAGIRPRMSTDEKIKRLKGLKIGISSPGSGSDQVLRTLLIARGYDPDKELTLLPLGQGDAMVAALDRGLVDGFVFTPPYPQLATAKGLGQTVVDPFKGDARELQGGTYLVLCTTRESLEKNRPAMLATLRAYASAMKLARERPEEARKLVRKYFSDLDDSVFNAMFDAGVHGLPRTPVLSAEQFKRTIDTMNISAKTPVTASFSSVVVNDLAIQATKDINGK